MSTKTVLLNPNAIGAHAKNVPINALPPEAWTWIKGGTETANVLEYYEHVPWLYRGINAIADSLAGLPFRFVRGDDELEVEEAYDLLPYELDLPALLNVWMGWLLLFGAAYADKGLNMAGRQRLLKPLHPSTMRPRFSEKKGLVGFERHLRDTQQAQEYEVDEVAYVWLPSRKAELGAGTPPAVAALRAAGVISNIDLFSAGYFERGAIDPMLITVPDHTSKDDKDRLEAWAKRFLQGVKNAFSIKAVREGVKVERVGTAPKDLVMGELTDKKREDIATALGVPHSLLFSNAANYATAGQDDKHFYDKTVIPYARLLVNTLNRQVFDELGLQLKERHDLLEMYQDDESDKAFRLIEMVNSGLAAPSEVRRQMNMEEMTPELREEVFEHLRNVALANRAAEIVTDDESELEDVTDDMPSEDDTPEPDDDSEDEEAAKAFTLDLDRWHRKACTRFDEGKPEKALEFESDAIPQDTAAFARLLLTAGAAADDVFAATARHYQRHYSDVKAYGITAANYRANLYQMIGSAFNVNRETGEPPLNRNEFAHQGRQLISIHFRAAFFDGLAEGGVITDELDPDEEEELALETNAERSYFGSFANEIYNEAIPLYLEALAAQDDAQVANSEEERQMLQDEYLQLYRQFVRKQEQFISRVDMWVTKGLERIYNLGKLSAQANQMMEWVLGTTEQHCSTCARAAGQRHRAKDWKRYGILPQADTLECGGFRCDCKLLVTNDRASGRLDRIPTKHVHA